MCKVPCCCPERGRGERRAEILLIPRSAPKPVWLHTWGHKLIHFMRVKGVLALVIG